MSATSWFHAAIFFHYGMQEFYILYPFYILICDVTYRQPFFILSRLFLTEMSLMFTVRMKGEKKEMESSSFSSTKKAPSLVHKSSLFKFLFSKPFFRHRNMIRPCMSRFQCNGGKKKNAV